MIYNVFYDNCWYISVNSKHIGCANILCKSKCLLASFIFFDDGLDEMTIQISSSIVNRVEHYRKNIVNKWMPKTS